MERRFEGLVYPEKDARRHLAQSLEEFSMKQAGERGIDILQAWVFEECRNWVQARRWCKDVQEGLYGTRWSVICRGAVEETKAHLEKLKWRVEELVQKGKAAKEEELEELQETSARIKDIEWNLEKGIPQLEFFEAKPMEDEYEAMVKRDIRVALEMREQ